MEYDRYENNNKLFIIGIICLISSLSLILFSLYVLPYLLWDLNYNIPDFILTWIVYLQDNYYFSSATSKLIFWLIFFIPGLITGIAAYIISNYIDNQIYKDELPEKNLDNENNIEEQKKNIKESARLGGTILFLMIAIVAAILLLQILLQATS